MKLAIMPIKALLHENKNPVTKYYLQWGLNPGLWLTSDSKSNTLLSELTGHLLVRLRHNCKSQNMAWRCCFIWWFVIMSRTNKSPDAILIPSFHQQPHSMTKLTLKEPVMVHFLWQLKEFLYWVLVIVYWIFWFLLIFISIIACTYIVTG